MQRADQTLTLADYEALGDGVRSGLAVAVARRADTTLRRFNTAQSTSDRGRSCRVVRQYRLWKSARMFVALRPSETDASDKWSRVRRARNWRPVFQDSRTMNG